MRVNFDTIRSRRTIRGTCSVCKKSVTKSMTFEQTVNPWNKNSDGSVKTRDQVRTAVNAEADAWNPDFRHERCKDS